MIKVINDFNKLEGSRGDHWSVVLHVEHTPAEALVVGTRIIVTTPGEIECEAIVRHGEHHQWVAEIVEDTLRYFDD